MILIGILLISFGTIIFYLVIKWIYIESNNPYDKVESCFALICFIMILFLINTLGIYMIINSDYTTTYIMDLYNKNKIEKIINLEINSSDTIKIVKYKIK